MQYAIELEDVSKSYGDTIAVDNLSLQIPTGKIYGILGPNGAGKTTTIELITGVQKPDTGTVHTLNQTVTANEQRPSLKELRKNVGIVPEKESPPSYQTPREYLVELIGASRDIPHDEMETRLDDWADALDLNGLLDNYNKDLSRGQQQKVMLIGAFIHEPDLLIIDEPLANLDPIIQERVKEKLRELNQNGTTIVLSTHQVAAAQELCNTISIMDKGTVIDTFEVEDLTEDLAQYFIKQTTSKNNTDQQPN